MRILLYVALITTILLTATLAALSAPLPASSAPERTTNDDCLGMAIMGFDRPAMKPFADDFERLVYRTTGQSC